MQMSYSLVSCQEEELQLSISSWDSYKRNTLQKKKDLYFLFADFGETFDQIPRDVVWFSVKPPIIHHVSGNIF